MIVMKVVQKVLGFLSSNSCQWFTVTDVKRETKITFPATKTALEALVMANLIEVRRGKVDWMVLLFWFALLLMIIFAPLLLIDKVIMLLLWAMVGILGWLLGVGVSTPDKYTFCKEEGDSQELLEGALKCSEEKQPSTLPPIPAPMN